MKKHLLILLIPFLVGCQNTKTPTSEVVTPTDNSLKEILTYLRKGKNYSFTYFQDTTISKIFSFAESAIAEIDAYSDENLKMYISDDKGIYPVGYHNEEYYPGEYISDNNDLYATDLVPSFYGKGKDFISSIEDDVTKIKVTDKTYKMDVIQAFGFSRLDYVKINSFDISYANKQLTFELTFGGSPYLHRYVSSDLGTTSIFEARDFLSKGGKVYTPDYDLKTTRQYFLNNNFVRSIYDINEKVYVGEELFNNKYFYSETSQTINELYLELNYQGPDPNDENETKMINLCGVYQGLVAGTRRNGFSGIKMASTPYNSKPDIKEVFHYPCFLSLWENMQYLREDEKINNRDYKSIGVVYSLDKMSFIVDFANNFNLNRPYPLDSHVPYKLSLDVFVRDDDPSQSQITFLYYFKKSGIDYCIPFPFTEFGTANIALADAVINTYTK